jgi:alkanesulfonate monooxygenase SsuD/methylene tetrahydromethanopterin reductase-like flavin-dependent oxidoreductase (luciferase family)
MTVQPAAFLRTTLPLGLDALAQYEDGCYHSIWMPDHMVSFWPDSIWTPEFTDLATVSPSPHRHLDGLAVAAAAAVLTTETPLASCVVDTVRRHPAMLAQSALTIDHLSQGRFILGLGSGELENTVPYGFDFARPVSRFEEAIEVIKLLWNSDGPVDFHGDFFRLEHARLDTERYHDTNPPIWIGAAGPRMLEITGRHADGWWPMGAHTPEDYAAKLAVVRAAADRAGRDPSAIVPALTQICLIGGDDDITAMLEAPLVKSIILLLTAADLRKFGYRHPMGEHWRGIMDFDPVALSRDKIIEFCAAVDTQAIRDIFPCGTPDQVAARVKEFSDAGMRVFKLMDYGGMAGLQYGALSAGNVRETEDAVARLLNGSGESRFRAEALDAAALMRTAQAATGLADWGDDTLPQRFGLAVDHLNGLGMDTAGRRRAADACSGLLTSRLEFFEDRHRYPIGDEIIDRPMFVTGEPRSGTTLMHALMSVDPDARALRFWEVMYPSPPPGLASLDDPRRARADADWCEINTKLPRWLHSHPYNDMLGDGLPEDERTWAFDFRVMTPTAWWRVPMQSLTMGLPTDPAAQYRIHQAMLQQFQYGRDRKYWVLKGFHGFRLKAFFTAYPDAKLVWLHRDPVQVAASRTMMMADIAAGMVGEIDLLAEAKTHLDMTRASIANTMANPLTDDPRIHHVRYCDFVADPIATVRGFYDFAGRQFTPAAETEMRDYLANNKGDRHGKFRYSTAVLTDIGENLDALHEEFRAFRERFGVEIEQRG